MDSRYAALSAVLSDYFDGLYRRDVSMLSNVFHPEARYSCATEGTLTCLGMDQYLPIVKQRQSPASRNEPRSDRIISIEFAGPVAAFVRAECVIGPKHFTDFLSFVLLDGCWQIIAKVFHFDLRE